jgi:hypothetical protein
MVFLGDTQKLEYQVFHMSYDRRQWKDQKVQSLAVVLSIDMNRFYELHFTCHHLGPWLQGGDLPR